MSKKQNASRLRELYVENYEKDLLTFWKLTRVNPKNNFVGSTANATDNEAAKGYIWATGNTGDPKGGKIHDACGLQRHTKELDNKQYQVKFGCWDKGHFENWKETETWPKGGGKRPFMGLKWTPSNANKVWFEKSNGQKTFQRIAQAASCSAARYWSSYIGKYCGNADSILTLDHENCGEKSQDACEVAGSDCRWQKGKCVDATSLSIYGVDGVEGCDGVEITTGDENERCFQSKSSGRSGSSKCAVRINVKGTLEVKHFNLIDTEYCKAEKITSYIRSPTWGNFGTDRCGSMTATDGYRKKQILGLNGTCSKPNVYDKASCTGNHTWDSTAGMCSVPDTLKISETKVGELQSPRELAKARALRITKENICKLYKYTWTPAKGRCIGKPSEESKAVCEDTPHTWTPKAVRPGDRLVFSSDSEINGQLDAGQTFGDGSGNTRGFKICVKPDDDKSALQSRGVETFPNKLTLEECQKKCQDKNKDYVMWERNKEDSEGKAQCACATTCVPEEGSTSNKNYWIYERFTSSNFKEHGTQTKNECKQKCENNTFMMWRAEQPVIRYRNIAKGKYCVNRYEYTATVKTQKNSNGTLRSGRAQCAVRCAKLGKTHFFMKHEGKVKNNANCNDNSETECCACATDDCTDMKRGETHTNSYALEWGGEQGPCACSDTCNQREQIGSESTNSLGKYGPGPLPSSDYDVYEKKEVDAFTLWTKNGDTKCGLVMGNKCNGDQCAGENDYDARWDCKGNADPFTIRFDAGFTEDDNWETKPVQNRVNESSPSDRTFTINNTKGCGLQWGKEFAERMGNRERIARWNCNGYTSPLWFDPKRETLASSWPKFVVNSTRIKGDYPTVKDKPAFYDGVWLADWDCVSYNCRSDQIHMIGLGCYCGPCPAGSTNCNTSSDKDYKTAFVRVAENAGHRGNCGTPYFKDKPHLGKVWCESKDNYDGDKAPASSLCGYLGWRNATKKHPPILMDPNHANDSIKRMSCRHVIHNINADCTDPCWSKDLITDDIEIRGKNAKMRKVVGNPEKSCSTFARNNSVKCQLMDGTKDDPAGSFVRRSRSHWS